MSRIEIIPVEYGRSVLPENMIFQNGAKDISRPIVFMIYLLKLDGRMILVDAGCETMPGFVMEGFCGPVSALEKIGVKPSDITDVIITHTHHDHVESVGYFENADIYVQRDEYENGKKYFTDNLKIILFDDVAEVADGVKAIKIGGHSVGSCIVEICDGSGKLTVISGDEVYSRECLKKKIPTGASFDISKSIGFVEKYSGSGYRVFLCHDN